MDANKLSSISQADTDEKIGEFWDTHDFTDFDNPDMPDVQFEITCAVPIEVELFTAIERQAQKRGVQVETLVNLWLQQKLAEQIQQAVA
jgi:hypothetical protein